MMQNNQEEDYYVLDEGFLDKGTFNLIKKWKMSNEKNRIKKFKSTTVSPEEAAALKDEINTMRTEDISYDEYKKAFHKFCTYIHTIDKGVILRTIKLTKNKDDDNFTLYVEYADNTKKITLPDDCKLYHLTKVSGIKKLIPFFKGKSSKGYLYDKPRVYFTIRKRMPKFLADYKVTDKMYTYECQKDIKEVYIDPLVPSFIQGAVYIETKDPVPVEQVGIKAGSNKEDMVEAKNEAYLEEKAQKEALKTLSETGFDLDEFLEMLSESGLEDLEPVVDTTDEEIHDGFEDDEVEEGAINFFKKKLKERKNKADWAKQGYTKEDLEEIKNIKDQIKKVGPDIVKKYNKDKNAVNSLKEAITDIIGEDSKIKPKFDFSVVEEDDKYYIIICILSKEIMDEVNYIDDDSDRDFTRYISKVMSAIKDEIKKELPKSNLISIRIDTVWSGMIQFGFSRKYNGTKESVESLYEADEEEEKEESKKDEDKSEVKDDESSKEETKDVGEPKVIKNDEDESPKENKDEDQTTEDNEVAKAEEDTTDSNTEGISDEDEDEDSSKEEKEDNKEDEEEKHTPESDEEDEKPEDEIDKSEEDSEAEDIDDELSNDVEEIEDNDDDDLDLDDEDEEVDDDSDEDDEDFGEDNDEKSTDDEVYDDEEDEDELDDDIEDNDSESEPDDSEDVEDIDTAEGISTDSEVVQEYIKEYCMCLADYAEELNESSEVIIESDISVITEGLKDIMDKVSSLFDSTDKKIEKRLAEYKEKEAAEHTENNTPKVDYSKLDITIKNYTKFNSFDSIKKHVDGMSVAMLLTLMTIFDEVAQSTSVNGMMAALKKDPDFLKNEKNKAKETYDSDEVDIKDDIKEAFGFDKDPVEEYKITNSDVADIEKNINNADELYKFIENRMDYYRKIFEQQRKEISERSKYDNNRINSIEDKNGKAFVKYTVDAAEVLVYIIGLELNICDIYCKTLLEESQKFCSENNRYMKTIKSAVEESKSKE